MKWRCLMVVALWAGAATGATPLPPTVDAVSDGNIRIVIRPESAVVRETFRAEINAARTIVRFPQLPRDVDPESLLLIDRRDEVKLAAWSRDLVPSNDRLRASVEGTSVHIELNAPTARDWPLISAEVENVRPGEKRFDLIYSMTGISWRASYDVLVRGSMTSMTEAVSVDVDGLLAINNTTTRTYSNAAVYVVGPDTLGVVPPPRPPGILELADDHPMSDLWRYQPPEPLMPNRYEVGRGLLIPARQETMFTYVAARRRPVDLYLVIRADEIPTDTIGPGGRPSLFIRFQNERDYAGGRAAPPGPAAIHVGSRTASLFQNAWFKHTPLDENISVDMGRMEGVQVRRVGRSRTSRPDGGYELIVELRVMNSLSEPVSVIVEESPPVNYTWNLLRASLPYEWQDRRMLFTVDVNPRAERVINYTIRVMVPED